MVQNKLIAEGHTADLAMQSIDDKLKGAGVKAKDAELSYTCEVYAQKTMRRRWVAGETSSDPQRAYESAMENAGLTNETYDPSVNATNFKVAASYEAPAQSKPSPANHETYGKNSLADLV